MPMVVSATVLEAHAGEPWRFRIEADSFHEGHLGSINSPIEIGRGEQVYRFRDGSFELAITFTKTGDAVKGRMAVTPGPEWDTVTIPFDGAVVGGVMEKKLIGTTNIQRLSFGRGKRDSRTIDIVFRLERL
jgi:hypothetical protein